MLMISYDNLRYMLQEMRGDHAYNDGYFDHQYENVEDYIRFEIAHKGIVPIPGATARKIAEGGGV